MKKDTLACETDDYGLLIPATKKAPPEAKPEANRKMRTSIFGSKWPEALDGWKEFKGAGWVFSPIEQNVFNRSYGFCEVNRIYFPMSELVALEAVDRYSQPNLIHREEAAKKGLMRCHATGQHAPPERMEEVRDENGKTIKVLATQAARAFFVCDYYKEKYPVPYRLEVYGSQHYKYVASLAVTEKAFAQCCNCGGTFEFISTKKHNDGRVCGACHAKIAYKDVIKPHNYNHYHPALTAPSFRMGSRLVGGFICATNTKVSVKQARLIGVEVETEFDLAGMRRDSLTRHEIALGVINALGSDFVMCKEDGTLLLNGHYNNGAKDDKMNKDTGPTYAGFEIVSAPADLATHRFRWHKLELVEGYKNMRAWDVETCGFHVHISRDPITYFQLARILTLINHPNNQLFIQKVAGRGSEKFCKYVPKEAKDALRVDPKSDENRRQAVNTCNAHTIEFRIFRGTVNPKHILRNIEFCVAVCDFCHPSSRSIKDFADYRKFIEFVGQNRKEWPLLAGWFALHKMIKADMTERFIVRKKTIAKHGGKKVYHKTQKIPIDLSKRTLKLEDITEHEIRVKSLKPEAKEF